MKINLANGYLAAFMVLFLGTCLPSSRAAVAHAGGGVLAFLYTPDAAPPRWNTLANAVPVDPRAALCFYSLRRLRPMGYLSLPDGFAGVASFKNGFLIAVRSAGPTARPGKLAGRFTVITEYNPMEGRTVMRRKYNWWVSRSYSGHQTSFLAGPDGIVWLTRFVLQNGKVKVVFSSLNWPTGRIVGSEYPKGDSAIPFVFAVKGAALMVFERGGSAAATVAWANGTFAACTFPKGFRGVPYFMAARGHRLDGMSMTGGYFISIDLGRTKATAWERKLGGIHGGHVRGYANLGSAAGVVLVRDFGRNACDLVFVSTATGAVAKRVAVDFPGCRIVVFGGRIFLISPGGRVARCSSGGKIQRVGPPPFGPLGLLAPTAPLSAPRAGK